MSELNWQRHQFRRFITGEAKHQTLIARTTRIDSHGDIWRLSIKRRQYGAGVAIETKLSSRVANLADCFTRDSAVVEDRFGCNLTGNDDKTGCHERLASDACLWIGSEGCIKDSVGNLIG